jgi:uncharacterized protein (DUF362 family)
MKKFVKPGANVVIKPNMGWARKPDQAANTNPELLSEVIRLCRSAGARSVKVLDNPVDRPVSAVATMSGIRAAAESAGARFISVGSPAMFQKYELKRGKVLKTADVLREVLRADVFINIPIAKVHGSTAVTLGCKNLMGTVRNRGAWHSSSSLDQCIADYVAHVRPNLVIVDAVRVLLTNGPKGPGRTKDLNVVVAGTDPVAVDAYGATLLGQRADRIGHLRLAHTMGAGEIDLKRVKIKHV